MQTEENNDWQIGKPASLLRLLFAFLSILKHFSASLVVTKLVAIRSKLPISLTGEDKTAVQGSQTSMIGC